MLFLITTLVVQLLHFIILYIYSESKIVKIHLKDPIRHAN